MGGGSPDEDRHRPGVQGPIKTATADFALEREGDQTRIAIDYEFTPRGGVVGKAATPALKKAFTKAFSNFLADWEAAA